MIFTTSFGFMNPTIKVAKQFPKVKFEHATGYKRADNVSTYNGALLRGPHVAAHHRRARDQVEHVGYIGSFPIPEVVRGINAFVLAAQKIRPGRQGQGGLGQHLVRPGQGRRRGQGPDRPGRRHHLASARPPTCAPSRPRAS